MTTHPIHTLPPMHLRGYAHGLRNSAVRLYRVAEGHVDLNDARVSTIVVLTGEAWEREADLVEAFATRLEAAEAALAQALRDIDGDGFRFSPESMAEVEAMLPPCAEPDLPRPVTPERVAAWAARFEGAAHRAVAHPPSAATICAAADAQCVAGCTVQQDGQCGRDAPASPPLAQRWYQLITSPTRHATLAEALAETPDATPVAAVSSEWAGTRYAFRVPNDEGTHDACIMETLAEAQAYLADLPRPTPEEAAQPGLADAVAESLAPPAERPQRSDSPWSEERLALLRRLYPTIMALDAIYAALNALPGLLIPSPEAVRLKAQKLDLHRRREAIPEEFAGASASRSRSPQMAKAAPQHAHSRSENGGKAGTWTAEREAILRRDYPGIRPLEDVYADLNSLPGPPVASIGALQAQATKLRLRRRAPKDVGEPIAPRGEAGIPLTSGDRHEIREKLRTGQYKGTLAIVEDYGCPADEAQALVDEHRARNGKAA